MGYFRAVLHLLLAGLLLACFAAPLQAQHFTKNAFKGIEKARKRHPSKKRPYKMPFTKTKPSLKQQEALKKWAKNVERNFSAAAAQARLARLHNDPFAQEMLAQFDEILAAPQTAFPADFSAANKQRAAFFRKYFITRVKYIQNHRQEVLSRIEQTLSPKPPHYPSLLEGKNVVFAAVHHYNPFLAPASHEIVSLVKQYKKQNPQAQILIATEALSTTLNGKPVPPLTEENLSMQWLKANHWGETFNPYTPLAQENGITFLPLENYNMLLQYGQQTSAMYAKSPIGLEERNRYWAARIEDERHQKILETGEDYDLILVIAGEAHLRYTFPQNLPSIMKEKRAAVVDFSIRGAKLFSNYFWDKLPGRAEFCIIPPQNYIIKQTDPKTAQLLGADLYINTPL